MVEAVFDVVEPDDGSANDPDGPEAVACVAIRLQLPLFRFDPGAFPEPPLRSVHASFRRDDLIPEFGFGNRLPSQDSIPNRALDSEN